MAGTSQRDALRSRGSGAGAVLIEPAGSSERIGAILEEQSVEFERFESIESLLAGEAAPASIVLRASESLGRIASHELEPLRRSLPDTPVVVVCAEIRPGELRLALGAGATGVVLEDQLAANLGSCLEATRAGQVCVPKRHARQVEPAALSTREKQILGLVVMGYMNSEIATQLFVAESTVKSHLSSAFGKLGVRSRNEAVELILDPERGLGMGILELGGERIESGSSSP
jgi:DNA-binding NarL/FixJ family response regulator